MQCSGAELIIGLLEQQGVRLVAGIPGGALLPLYEALGSSRVIKHILARHEQAAGFIAQGLARMTGKAGVCFATSGPGVTNPRSTACRSTLRAWSAGRRPTNTL